jgi:hypothetical protein
MIFDARARRGMCRGVQRSSNYKRSAELTRDLTDNSHDFLR